MAKSKHLTDAERLQRQGRTREAHEPLHEQGGMRQASAVYGQDGLHN